MQTEMLVIILITCLLAEYTNSFPDFGTGHLDRRIQHNRSPFFKHECKCIRFKECNSFLNLAVRAKVSERNYIYEKIRNSVCDFVDDHPYVCCPRVDKNHEEEHVILPEEQPWVWDSIKLFNTNVTLKNTNQVAHKINYDFNEYDDFHQNLVDFEDYHTKKNCPPLFADGIESELIHKHKHPKNPHQAGFNHFDPLLVFHHPSPPSDHFKFTKFHHTNEKTDTHRGSSHDIKRALFNNEFCGVSVNTRIVGGRDSGPGQFPWVVRIAYFNKTSEKLSYRCAGSIITDKYIITAAHCVTNLVDELEISHIRIGDIRTKKASDCNPDSDSVLCRVQQDFQIEKIIPHSDYDSPKYANDIALIRILRSDESVPLTPICLPFNSLGLLDEELTGRLGIVAGWSSIVEEESDTLSQSGIRTARLQYVRLPIVNRTECAATYARFSVNSWTPIFIQPSQICAQGGENMDACQGDSGGPLMDDGSSDNGFRYTLLGLVSFGPRNCGVSNFPGVYTKVASYLDWIVANIQL